MNYQTCSFSHNGGQKNNDDFCLEGGSLWMIANGAGRAGTGQSAAAAALTLFLSEWKSGGSPSDGPSLQKILRAVGGRLAAPPEPSSGAWLAGVSMAAVAAAGPSVRFFSVGNTRAYYFREGRLLDRTEDDSVPGALCAAGLLPYEEIRRHPGRRLLLRSLEADGPRRGEIPVLSERAVPGDAFLLCTDGFWEQIYETEMEIDLSKSADPKQWMTYMVKRLLLKKKTGKTDCFSVTCGWIA